MINEQLDIAQNGHIDIRARKEWVKWMCRLDWTAMGTLKFRDMYKYENRQNRHRLKQRKNNISDYRAEKALTHYWKVIDRIFFGRTSERFDNRLQRSIVLHKGAYQNNIHYHFIAYHPNYSSESLCTTLKAVWEHHMVESSDDGRFEPVRNIGAVAEYFKHEWKILEQDTFEVFNTHLTDNNRLDMRTQANMDDIRRRRLKYHSPTDDR